MKKVVLLLVLLFSLGCAHAPASHDTVFQNAPINALLAGCYSGTMSLEDLSKHGDFGLGTLDSLDGEMVVLDNVFYQIQVDGKAYRLKDSTLSPFVTMTFFNAGQELVLPEPMDYQALQAFLDKKLPSENLIYAIKIEGRFPSLKVRSAARQKKPFPVLTEAIRDQKVFELKDQEGTLVGFRFPPYMEGVNVPGYHFHFLSKDKTLGGHVQDLEAESAGIQIDASHGFKMYLPGDPEFLKFHFADDAKAALAQVEQ